MARVGKVARTAKSILNPLETAKGAYNVLNPKAPVQAPQPATVAAPNFEEYKQQNMNTQESFKTRKQSKVSFNPDGSVNYTFGDLNIPNLSKEEYRALVQGQGGIASFPERERAKYSENVQLILDTEEAERLLYKEDPRPEALSTPGATKLYNELVNKEKEGKISEIQAIAEREAGKPVEEIEKQGSAQQAAGFAVSGALGGLGIGGTAALGAKALGIGAAIGAGPVGWALAGAAALNTARAFMANQGKNRALDISNANTIAKDSIKYVNLYKTQALNPNADVDQLIEDYYAMKRQVYASYALIEERSLFDTTFRANEGVEELSKIKIWMQNEDNLDREFFNNLANANNDVYNARISGAMASFNQETTE